jgi:chloramphenicol-sensitive protein RarD
LVWLRSDLPHLRRILRERRQILALSASTLLLAANWLLFIWAVAEGYVLQASLGYFINPLMNVLFGVVLLRERLRSWQMAGIAVTASGVVFQALRCGGWPWIALCLATTFSLYGLVRKVVRTEAILGLTVETLLMAPLGVVYLLWLHTTGTPAFAAGNLRIDVLLVCVGVVTAIPLILFVTATRLLRYSTVGVIQYIGPTGQFLLAVLAYHEPFTLQHLISFSLVWAGIAIYLLESRRATLQQKTIDVGTGWHVPAPGTPEA